MTPKKDIQAEVISPAKQCRPSVNPAPLDEDEKLLMLRLNWCQSADEYSEIRAGLEVIYNDSDGRYWALLPVIQEIGFAQW